MPTEAIHKTLRHPELVSGSINQINRSRVEHRMTITFVYNSDIYHHRNGGFMKDFIMRIKKSAFTLAEVLITLGIIGVVAALTLPTLIQNHQKQVYVTGLKKAYSNIQNAFSKMMLDEGITDWKQSECYNIGLYDCINKEATYNDSNNCLNNLQKQFKIVSTTPMDSYLQDFSSLPPLAGFTTSDGVIYQIFGDSSSYGTSDFTRLSLFAGKIAVDVNGLKGPNKLGRDQFVFDVDYDKNKIVPSGISIYYRCTTEAVNNNSENAQYCAAKVIIEGKMNY